MRSDDSYLNTLGARYSIVSTAIESLSKQVRQLLDSYDRRVETALTMLFDDCNMGCIGPAWGSCYGYWDPVTISCVVVAIMGCLAWGPLYPTCVAPLLAFCGNLDLVIAVGCAILAAYVCCVLPPPPPPPPPGGGCPILTVFTGDGYTTQGLLDIHSDHDIVRAFYLNVQAVPLGDRFLMRLTEHHQTISHVDQARIFVRVCDGELVELPLVRAIHSEKGDVSQALLYSDNMRVDELGADHNNGTSQHIDLEFLALGHVGVTLIIVIEGYNSEIKT